MGDNNNSNNIGSQRYGYSSKSNNQGQGGTRNNNQNGGRGNSRRNGGCSIRLSKVEEHTTSKGKIRTSLKYEINTLVVQYTNLERCYTKICM